jgi:hypothetical protein
MATRKHSDGLVIYILFDADGAGSVFGLDSESSLRRSLDMNITPVYSKIRIGYFVLELTCVPIDYWETA